MTGKKYLNGVGFPTVGDAVRGHRMVSTLQDVSDEWLDGRLVELLLGDGVVKDPMEEVLALVTVSRAKCVRRLCVGGGRGRGNAVRARASSE